MLDGLQDGVFCDFVENDTLGLINVQSKHMSQVPRDGLSLAVLIGCEPHVFRPFGSLLQFRHHILLIFRNDIHGSEIIEVHTEILLFQVAYMSVAGHHLIVFSQEFLEGFGFCR